MKEIVTELRKSLCSLKWIFVSNKLTSCSLALIDQIDKEVVNIK